MGWLARLFNAVPADEMAGASLYGLRWQVRLHDTSPPAFYRGLKTIAPTNSVLVLEGTTRSEVLRAFLRESARPEALKIARGTMWPRQDVFHLPASAEVFETLARNAEEAGTGLGLWFHIHLYVAGRVVLEWNDAFHGPCYVSKDISENHVMDFGKSLGGAVTDGDDA